MHNVIPIDTERMRLYQRAISGGAPVAPVPAPYKPWYGRLRSYLARWLLDLDYRAGVRYGREATVHLTPEAVERKLLSAEQHQLTFEDPND